MLISTGMANEKEITEALSTARDNGCQSILLFHCISSYPAPIEEANLNQIINLKKNFNVLVGLSDHTIGNTCSIAAVALGACAIEKHFTLDRNERGPDSEFSMEPSELENLVIESKNAWESIGKGKFERSESEKENLVFRRSLYFVKDLKSGQRITLEDIRRIRPGFGLPPKFFEKIIGMKLKKDVSFGDPVSWDKIEKNN